METPVVQKLMTELVAHQEVLRAFVGAALSCYPDDIDDVVQNANLAVIRRVDDFDPARPLLPWLIAFAKRQILAFRSKRGAERLVFDEAALERLAETYVTCDSADLPVMTRLAICKRKLDEETRKMLEERYGDDRKPRELAKLHGTTSREIRNRLTYARRKLAECIMRLCRISESSFERDFGDSTELEGLMSEALDGAADARARQKVMDCASGSPERMREYGELALVDALLRSQYAARRAKAPARPIAAEKGFGHGWLKAAGWALAAVGLTAIAATTGYIYSEKTQTTKEGTSMNTAVKSAMMAVASIAQMFDLSADVRTWIGDNGIGTWQTESCWEPAGVPAAADAVIINSGSCQYIPGGDLSIAANGSLTLKGGRFYQTDTIAWMQVAGKIDVGAGAEFDMGTAEQLNLSSGGLINIDEGGVFKATTIIAENGGMIDIGGLLTFKNQANFLLTDGVYLDGGTISNVGELQWNADREIAGSVSAVKLAAQQNAGVVLTVGTGTITLSAALADTVWQVGTSYVRVKTGATTEFVFIHEDATPAAVYSTLFAGENPKIRYGSETFADEAAFRERFEVSGEQGDVHVKAIALSDDHMVFGGAATVQQGTENDLIFSVSVQKAGKPAGDLYLVWGTTDRGKTLEGWDQKEKVVSPAKDETVYGTVKKVEPYKAIYYLYALSNETEIVYSSVSPRAMVAGDAANLFLGTVSSDAANAANWSRGRVPTATDTVVFLRDLSKNDLDWPANLTSVGGWLQPKSDTTGYVTFALLPTAPLTIAGDAVLDGGVWTHVGAGVDHEAFEPTAAVAASIRGNLHLGADATITAGSGELNIREKRTRGWYLSGPGFKEGTGASYGGEGSADGIVYGSVFSPMEYGSSGTGDGVSYAGGGLVVLSVLGRAEVNGSITARGYGWNGMNGGSSGGSLNLSFGSLDGSGVIAADAGILQAQTFDSINGSGSGGRVAIRLTDADSDFSLFKGTVTAYGNRGRNKSEEYDETPCSAAGTVFLATGSETAAGSGEIVVANGELTNGDATAPGPRTLATQLPGNGPRCDGNAAFRRRRLSIRDYGRVKLTDSFRVSSLSLEGENAALDLNGKTLSTLSLNVNGQEFRPGTYTAAQIGLQVTGAGSVVVGGQGFRIIIR